MFKKRKSLENIDISRLLVRQAGIEPAAFTIEQGISLIA